MATVKISAGGAAAPRFITYARRGGSIITHQFELRNLKFLLLLLVVRELGCDWGALLHFVQNRSIDCCRGPKDTERPLVGFKQREAKLRL